MEDFGKATGGTSIESEFSEDGVYKVISIGSYSENSVYNDQGIRAIKSDKTSNRVLNRNDLTMILNDKTTSGNIIGRVLLIEESGIYVYNQRTERIEINLDEYDPVFLYEMLNAPNIREKIIKQAQGNTQIYVNWTTISLLEYMIPSKEEQVKIGEHLHGISNLIALHQRKYFIIYNKLITWEQRKLSDIADVRDGTHASPKYISEGHPLVTSKNVKDGFVNYDDIQYISDEDFDEINKRSKVDVNDVLMGMIGTIGNIALIRKEPDFAIKNVALIKDAKKINYLYLYHFLQSNNTTKQLTNSMDGGTQKFIALGNIRNLDIDIPSDQEQAKLGQYFESLDHIITLHRRAL